MAVTQLAFCAKCGKELPASATFCPACGTPVPTAAGAGATATAAPSGTTAAPMSGVDTLMKDSAAQGYWVKRLIALIIDGIIIGVVVFIVAAIGVIGFLATGGMLGLFFGGFTILFGVLLILYFPLMESMRGATFGKQFMGLKVIGKSGTNPTFVDAFVRNVSKIYWLLLLLDVIIGLATTKGYQQKYTDHMVGTSVVPR